MTIQHQTVANIKQARPNKSPTPSMGSVSSHAQSVSCKSQLFNSISSYTGYQDCSTLNVAEIIERDCLSVLHKLHDQVNGLQLVQVVVQPLAKLFNPTNLANISASKSLSNNHINNNAATSSLSTQHQNVNKQSSVSSTPSSMVATYMMTPDTVQSLIARLDTDRDVNWLMEIIGYGLSMPFSLTGEQDSVKDCCTIYCEWLTSALLPYQDINDDSRYKQLSKLLPIPIRDDPNRYARKMLSHLYNIFLPRQISPITSSHNLSAQEQQQALLTSVSRQAVLCHRVLRTIETIARNPDNLMENKTWDHLLAFLLTVNDKLLSSPTEPDDIGTQLCDRILGVLFELMLLACSRSLPTPSQWKTFHQLSLNWRHRPALIDHWRRITLMLTKRLTHIPEFSDKIELDKTKQNLNSISDSKVSIPSVSTSAIVSAHQPQISVTFPPIESVVDEMSYDLVAQAWYRFLNLIGNPVELSNPDIISKTDEFYHYACASDNVVDPRQHPCLNVLPAVFHKSMKGVTDFIDTFLRTSHRPKCNTILHIFGDWLFSVALLGSDLDMEITGNDELTDLAISTTSTSHLATSSNRQQPSPTSSGQSVTSSNSRILRTGHSPSSLSTVKNSQVTTQSGSHQQYPDRVLLEQQLTPDSFEAGQAEAIGVLCKLFSSKLSDEDISPVYLSRFYLCLQHCLTYGFGEKTGIRRTQILTSVLVNSVTLLQYDLDGINILIPLFISAIELVFECYERDSSSLQQSRPQPKLLQQSKPSQVPKNNELRRACISMLLTLLAYPLHFRSLPIRNCLNETSPTMTFASLRPRLVRLLMIALQIENDPLNMQMLFGGLSLSIHDILSAKPAISFDATETTAFNNNSLENQDRPVGSGYRSSKSSMSTNKPEIRSQSFSTNSQSSDASQSFKTTGGNRSQKGADTSKLSDTLSITSSTYSMSSEPKPSLNDSSAIQSFIYESTDGFIIKSLHVVCHLLINVWKHDTQVSLSALELLTSIARQTSAKSFQPTHEINPTSNNDRNEKSHNNETIITTAPNGRINMRQEYKQATKWICDYIGNQCSRPPPAHSKDMHSTIVAAYHCLSVWFYNHPYLLQDQACVDTVMETIELGVSGQKSKTSVVGAKGLVTTVISRDEKSMKPSSMRVREAAESLLNSCMVRTRIEFHGSVAERNLSETIDSDFDERTLVGLLKLNNNLDKTRTPGQPDASMLNSDPHRYFKYFSDDNLTIFAFMDCLDEPNFKDSVICLIRSPFGKHCWQFKFRRYSAKLKDKVLANRIPGLVKRPQPHNQQYSPNLLSNSPLNHQHHYHHHNLARCFPETLDKLPRIRLDSFVPSLETYLSKNDSLDIDIVASDGFAVDNSQKQLLKSMHDQMRSENEKMIKIFHHQILAEQKAQRESSIRLKKVECEEPQPTNDLEAARLIISQLGYASSLVTMNAMDNHKLGLDLTALDKISVQTCDTANVYYIRKNKVSLLEILESPTKRKFVSRSFFELLLRLGRATVVRHHSRWTGKASTSWDKSLVAQLGGEKYDELSKDVKMANSNTDEIALKNQYLNSDTGGSVFDGERMTLYWSDMTQELAFILPHKIVEMDYSAGPEGSSLGGEFRADLSDNEKLLLRTRSRGSTDNHSYSTDNADGRSISSMTSDDAASQTSHSMRISSSIDNRNNNQSQHHQSYQNQFTQSIDKGFIDTNSSVASLRTKKKSANLSSNIGCDTTIIICWLECYDDMPKVPTDWLLSISETGVFYADQTYSTSGHQNKIREPPRLKARDFVKIFICPMKNGLYKINIRTSFGKQWLALPLIDNMTVSGSMLADLIRCSVLNSCRRRRLDTDSYQPPHVKRRLKILEISGNYKVEPDKTGLHNYLFRPHVSESITPGIKQY